MKKVLIALTLNAAIAAPTWAAQQTVILSVPSMNCAACPITVKKALKNVEGVGDVNVEYSAKQATVVFDDALTNIEALTGATSNAGYPSHLAESPVDGEKQ